MTTANSAETGLALSLIGAGALGLSLAARLAPHCRLQLITRSSARAEELRRGVVVGARSHRFDACTVAQARRGGWVLVLVKTPDTAAAMASACQLQPRGILSLQNGLIDDWLPAPAPGQLIAQGVTTAGAWRDEDGVHPSGDGETLLPVGSEEVLAVFAAAGLPARICDQLQAARLAKLLVNAAINPLAAVLQRRNGELLAGGASVLLDALVAEAWPVLQAQGLALDAAAARARVREVARATAANRASMLQDVLAGRATEIDAITGAVLAMAAAQGQDLPTHEAMYTLVKRLQAGPQS